VDGLHERAGSRNVVELYGNILRSRCSLEDHVTEPDEQVDSVPQRGQRCGAYLRPDEQDMIGAIPPALSGVLVELAEALVPESGKAELEATRQRIQKAGEVRDVVWLARREQSSPYSPTYSVPGR